MANLTALREKIKNITDYSPELQQFNDQLDELVNDAYYQIWTHKRWNFGTVLTEFAFHVDMTPEREDDDKDGTKINIAAANGSRLITFSAGMDRFRKYPYLWEGSPIEIQGYEYTITKVATASRIFVDQPFFGETKADDDSWKIKKRWYDLPEDCLELLYIGHRDYPYVTVAGTTPPYGKASGLMPRREEEFGLRADYALNYAEAYIPTPTKHIPAAERLKIQGSETSGDLPNNKWFELCWAFYKEDKVGPLSEPTVYHNHGNDSSIDLEFVSWDGESILADLNDTDLKPSQWEGYRKKIYYNKNFDRDTGERTGLPCWLEVTKGGLTRGDTEYLEPVVVDDTSSSYTLRYINQLDNGSRRYIEIDGSHQQIRPYPRVNGYDIEIEQIADRQYHDYVKTGIIRYYKKPKDLLLGTDSPEMPYEFHQLIVYKALEIIYLKLGDAGMAGTYEKKYEKAIKDLEKRYVDKIDVQPIRSQFGLPRSFRGYTSSDLKYGG